MLDIDAGKAIDRVLDRFGVPKEPMAAQIWLGQLLSDVLTPLVQRTVRQALNRKIEIDLSGEKEESNGQQKTTD